ncbi:LysR family transcriptional regulator [Pseudarthrobacter sp. P1]|uniref:LysR family transcriptional regulator n=1 Tax=Pseudarthrobacter sp. P1 TaxID=3418418 RepID=UPI003CF15A93
MMELGQLRALRELSERGSIAAAARALHVTPSSISQQLSALARRAGTPLTFRDGRRTALTPAGLALARAAVGVEVAMERAESAVGSFRHDARAQVRVAAFHSAGLALFRRLAAEFVHDGGPQLMLGDADVAQQDFPSLVADYDLVLAHRLPNSPPWPDSVAVVPLAFEPLDIALARSHPLAAKQTLVPADLRGVEWVAVRQGFPLQGAIELIQTLAGEEAVVRHRINEFFVAASLVEGGGLAALVPRYTVARQLFPALVLRPLAAPVLGRRIDILARPEALERGGVAQVVAALRTIMAAVIAETEPHPRR